MAVLKLESNILELSAQFDSCPVVTGKMREFLYDYLVSQGIYSLDDVAEEDKRRYFTYVDTCYDLTNTQRAVYKNAIELVLLYYLKPNYEELCEEIKQLGVGRAIQNTLSSFLIQNDIRTVDEITYDVRHKYEEYLSLNIKKVPEYVRAMDVLVHKHIQNRPIKRDWHFSEEKKFLLYYPDYEIANSFSYTQDKNALMFDFSLDAPIKMKKQVFEFLNYVVQNVNESKRRHNNFLAPLSKFYKYCVDNQINDIEQLLETDEEGFRASIDGKVGTKTNVYMEILYHIRRFLFLSSEEINWEANVWYLERIEDSIRSSRINPSRPIATIKFTQITNDKNRRLLKQYIKYLLSLAHSLSLTTVRNIYYSLLRFMKYCDRHDWNISSINEQNIYRYAQMCVTEDIKPATCNRRIASVNLMFIYTNTHHITDLSLDLESYYKMIPPYHVDKALDAETQKRMLIASNNFDSTTQTMFVTHWASGRRLSDICCLKAKDIREENGRYYIYYYQVKLENYVKIPIIEEVYLMLKNYISEKDIKADDFIFQNRKGGAYDAGTYMKKIKKEFEKNGLGDISYKSHSHRHTVATEMNNMGISIQVIRDFLGQKNDNMTKQYIDHMEKTVMEESRRYFEIFDSTKEEE